MRYYMLVALAFCSAVGNANATSAIAVREPTFLVFGADSKIISETGAKRDAACKIGTSNNVFWVASGILAAEITHFSVSDIAANSLSTSGNIDDRINNFVQIVAARLTVILNIIHNTNPRFFKSEYVDQPIHPALEIAFGTIKDDVAHLYFRQFIVKTAPFSSAATISVMQTDMPQPGQPPIGVADFGLHEIIANEIAKPDVWATIALPKTIRRLIKMEISAHFDEVGPPISIVLIDKSGAHWINKGKCTG